MFRFKRARGNVLMVAIFMAIFLFFLSVALVSQNRMDISLGLSVDHRLRAQEGSRSGLEFALSVMRTRSNWATLLDEDRTLETGATYNVTVTPYASDLPNTYKVVSTGVSGLVKSQSWALVEEYALPTDGKKSGSTYLFSKTLGQTLAMAGPDFRWHDLGSLPNPQSTLAANQGPLFVFDKPGSGTPPPSFLDQLPLFLQNEAGEITQQPGPLVRVELVPPGEHLLYLDFENDEAEWKDIPDPGTQLGKAGSKLTAIEDSEEMRDLPVVKIWQEPEDLPDDRPPWHRRNVRLKGQNRGDSGFDIFAVEMDNGSWADGYGGRFQSHTYTIPWRDVENAAGADNTLEWDEITGPQIYLEWYSIDGTALFAQDRKVFCHGTHYFYGHINMKDVTWPEYGTPAYESIVFRRPCVLEFDLDSEKWTPIHDFMRVSNPEVEPELHNGPNPAKKDLVVTSLNSTYCFSDDSKVVKFRGDHSFDLIGGLPTNIEQLVLYDDEIFYYSNRGLWADSILDRKALTSLDGTTIDPNPKLSRNDPPVTARVLVDEEEREVQVRPAQTLELGLQASGHDVAVGGQNLVCAGRLQRKVDGPEQDAKTEPPNDEEPGHLGYLNNSRDRTLLTLFHFDGKHWQVWPAGSEDLLRTEFRETEATTILARTAKDTRIEIQPQHLTLAHYDEGSEPINRYRVICSGRGAGP